MPMVSIRCPHCQHTFDYPIPSNLLSDGQVLNKSTTCPICEQIIIIPFQAKARTTTVYRGESSPDSARNLPAEILAEKGV